MDVSKKGGVKFSGNLQVAQQVVTQDLHVKGESILEGDLIISGKIVQLGENPQEKNPSIIHLGDPSVDNSWRFSVSDGELSIEKREGDEWVVKQNLS